MSSIRLANHWSITHIPVSIADTAARAWRSEVQRVEVVRLGFLQIYGANHSRNGTCAPSNCIIEIFIPENLRHEMEKTKEREIGDHCGVSMLMVVGSIHRG
jgi:hypothetical protein